MIQASTSIAKEIAAEDIRPTDFIALLATICEYPTFFWCLDSATFRPEDPIRIQWRSCDGGTPLKVKSVCLPFVLVKSPQGDWASLDVRLCRIARLSDDYAVTAWEAMRVKRRRKPSKKRKR